MATEELDDLSAFEAKETSHRLPLGWVLLFWGLVVWGCYYLWAYTPALGGWSQAQDLEAGAAAGTNVFYTVLFTAIPTLAAILIVLGQRRRR